MSNSYTDQQKHWVHSFKINYHLLGLEVPFIQKSIIKYLFEPVDFFYTLLKCKSLESPTADHWIIMFNFSLINNYLIPGSIFIFTIIVLTKLYNCTSFNLFWNLAFSCCIVFCTFFLVFIVIVVNCYLIGKSNIDKLVLPKVVRLMVK